MAFTIRRLGPGDERVLVRETWVITGGANASDSKSERTGWLPVRACPRLFATRLTHPPQTRSSKGLAEGPHHRVPARVGWSRSTGR